LPAKIDFMKLTPSQKEAVTFTGGDAIIVAGAGSGKTLVLVEKVAWLVEELKVSPSEIAVITFTEKAAGELQERIARDDIFIGTIHAFASSLIRQHPSELGIDPDFQIMDEPLSMLERAVVIRKGLIELAEKGDSAAMEALENFGLRRSLKLLADLLSRNEFKPSPLLSLLLELKNRYQASKKEKRFLDFQDLEDLAIRLLRDPDQRRRHQEKYRWIFVDEFQDTSADQWKLLTLLHDPPNNRLVLVGDPRQSIYRFRGADPALFEKAKGEIGRRGGRILYLNENFRSQAGVIRFVNRVGERLFESFQPLIATRPSKGAGVERIELPETGSADERRGIEAERVAQKILDLKTKGIAWDEIALLFRTRRAIPFFEEAFQKEGIPYETRGGRSLLETPEVLSLNLWLRSLADPDDRIARTGLDYSPLKGITVSPEPDIGAMLETLFREALPRFIGQRGAERNLLEFKKLLLRLLTLGVRDLREMIAMIEGLRSDEARIPIPADGVTKGRVQLLTVHAAKGLEFPVVFLCDLAARGVAARSFTASEEEILLPKKDGGAKGLKERLVKSEEFLASEEREKEEELQESRRLLYVALTRAADLLIVPRESGKKETSRTRWIDLLHEDD
jgi:ATP-dependent exoDNAse (exonuclease V) beta subunit